MNFDLDSDSRRELEAVGALAGHPDDVPDDRVVVDHEHLDLPAGAHDLHLLVVDETKWRAGVIRPFGVKAAASRHVPPTTDDRAHPRRG